MCSSEKIPNTFITHNTCAFCRHMALCALVSSCVCDTSYPADAFLLTDINIYNNHYEQHFSKHTRTAATA